jgi:hypothetical protein
VNLTTPEEQEDARSIERLSGLIEGGELEGEAHSIAQQVRAANSTDALSAEQRGIWVKYIRPRCRPDFYF